jgi:hydrogenase maturation factor
MKSEIFFLKYAFPCSFVLLSRKEITPEEHELLYKSAKDEKLYLPVKRIESIFWRAMKFIGSIKDLKAVQKYWWFDHNKYLKQEKFKNVDNKQCMIIPCEVVSVSNDKATVKSTFLDRDEKLKLDFVDVKVGDKVTKHYDYVCGKIPESLYLRIGESLKRLLCNNFTVVNEKTRINNF